MGFLDILAKLGILRFGTKTGTYRNAKERPAEFMMDSVFNAERDLVGGDKGKPEQARRDEKSGGD